MNKKRCSWAEDVDDVYVEYHDKEWGVPTYDDRELFEMLVLESFQAGLAWITILKKRENFRNSFDNFDVRKVANYDEDKIEELRNDKGIIRHKGKINAAINNANIFIEIQEEFGSFSNYIWHFTDNQILKDSEENYQTNSPLSNQIAKDLKERGMKFVGTTIIYSYLESIGIINNHIHECFRYTEL
ncbi:DNA-3-methyladenine glycosylase I [Methanobrevibacter olleyae]|uniref:DNA-3-methyladenine glycosylase I n=1 Tax=Methanobrevibacter olleyae TaxID=294671 RepID=A0A126R2U0_METOL|nr:DNA-3-methyladenine glycosylase I [Methanobrevibacter olleyae]AMK16356.1 DNA-3-methyladenine glycosylase I Tag [Methanobrevibacter olleyae]SFL67683.1 DNA-3-methyladenine glycosylase I [Methanobrevibacter olleyae]